MNLTPNQQRLIERHPHMEGVIRGTETGTPTGPGLLQRATNFVAANVRYHRNNGWILPLEEANPRSDICHTNKCGKYDAGLDRCQHQRCGCNITEKVTWSTESCPEGLWLPMYGPAPGPSVPPG